MERFQLGYRRELDGLRGIAIILVLVLHLRVGFLVGGHIGVDLFFGLSGFLITSLLLAEYERNGRIDLRAFYSRRALRLLPALSLLLLTGAILVVSHHWMGFPGSSLAGQLEAGVLSSAFYVSNWVQAYQLADVGPLRHTWSLAIEEQFYLVWPVTLIFLMKRFRPRTIVMILCCLFVLAGIERAAIWSLEGWERAYRGFDTRSDALLVGCVVAFLVRSRFLDKVRVHKTWLTVAMSGACAVLLSVALKVPQIEDELYVGYYTLVALSVGVLLLYLAALERTPLHGFLSVGLLVWLGQISYGLYLWHYFIFRIDETASWEGHALRVAGSLAAASLSYYLAEKPLLRLKGRVGLKASPTAATRPEEAEAARSAA